MNRADKQDTSYRFAILAKILMVGSLLLIISALLLEGYLFMSPAAMAKGSTRLAITKSKRSLPHKRPVISAGKYQQEVTTASQNYMNALMQQHYDVMWSMLDPSIRIQWADQAAFTSYLTKRFQGFTIHAFTTGSVNDLSYWINPETMTRYDHVEEESISLQVTATNNGNTVQTTIDQHANDVLQNIPLIVQRANQGLGKGEVSQWYVLQGGPADPEAPLLPPTNQVNNKVNLPILMYHYISEVPANDANPVLRKSLSVTPNDFSQQLDYLKSNSYHSITFNQLMNALYYGVQLPTKPIIFSFDDGYIDAYTDAYPVLKAHGYTGMFYIITGKVGWQGQASWAQLREMLANGMQMGSHTVHHVEIGKTYQSSPDQAQQEVQVAQFDMQKQLGIAIQHFCYPNGDPFKGTNTVLQQKIKTLLEAQGYTDATTDPGPTGTLQNGQAPYVFLRLRIDGRSSFNAFQQLIQTNA